MKLLITGSRGFTGLALIEHCKNSNIDFIELKSDLTDYKSLEAEITLLNFDYIVHLAGISNTFHDNGIEYYNIHVIGTENLLKVIYNNKIRIIKIIISSSAYIYGNQDAIFINENALPSPNSHYAISKFAMEKLVLTYNCRLPIIITRPFNYTGINQKNNFIIPKLIQYYLSNELNNIELGNLYVRREFNDINFVIKIYIALIKFGKINNVYNICSGNSYNIIELIDIIEKTNYNQKRNKIKYNISKKFSRENEILNLVGDSGKLKNLFTEFNLYFPETNINNTIHKMLNKSV
jgi:nucleoside-diphosphate-sugar epimerase